MVYENNAAEDYQIKVSVVSTPVQTGAAVGLGDAVTEYWTWGNEYFDAGVGSAGDPRNHGIKVTISHEKRSLIDPATTQVTFRFPDQDVTHTLTFGGWIDIESLMDLTAVGLTTDARCNAWGISWTSLVWSINGVVFETLGSYSKSGSIYDRRLNRVRHEAGGGPNVVTQPTSPVCTDLEAETTVSGSASGGWRHKVAGVWTNEPITIVAQTLVTPTSCSCRTSIAASLPTGVNSWTTTIPYVGTLSLVITVAGTSTCTCSTTGGTAVLDDDLYTLTVLGRSGTLDINPDNANILRTEKNKAFKCWNSDAPFPIPPFSIISVVTDESTTKAAYRADVSRMIGTIHCIVGVPPPCPLPGVVTCDVASDPRWCAFFGYAELLHPIKPTCGTDCNGPQHLTVGVQDAILYATCVDSGSIYVRRFNFLSINEQFLVHAGSAVTAQSAWHPFGWLGCYYNDSGTCYVRYSYNKATSWSAPVSIATGTNPTPAVDYRNGIEYCAIHNGTKFQLWRRLTSAASWANISDIITTAAAQAGLEVQGDNSNRLVFTVNDAGTVKQYVSLDMGATWTLI